MVIPTFAATLRWWWCGGNRPCKANTGDQDKEAINSFIQVLFSQKPSIHIALLIRMTEPEIAIGIDIGTSPCRVSVWKGTQEGVGRMVFLPI
ncbi:hypothetical protein MTR_4g103785 [Medicago truncatula]|uniref:Heat shock protein 70 family n=1 Tax=Medicago truncatula TaxID=3880 RepID=A0A072UQU1_MEDTR|nr:hypothetical protein MTR_4g103785 [Medicago truncatula]